MSVFESPTAEQRRSILIEYGIQDDRRIRERECAAITSLSRSTRSKMENKGRFPARCHFGRNSCAWLLSDVLLWVRNPPAVDIINNPHSPNRINVQLLANSFDQRKENMLRPLALTLLQYP